MNQQQVIEFLKNKRITHFSTISLDGNPRVRVFSIAKITDGRIYFFTGSFKEVWKEIKANPNVEFSVHEKEGTIRVRGKVTIVKDQNVLDDFNKEFPHMLKFYKGHEDSLKLIYLEHPEILIFEMKKNFDPSSFHKFILQ